MVKRLYFDLTVSSPELQPEPEPSKRRRRTRRSKEVTEKDTKTVVPLPPLSLLSVSPYLEAEAPRRHGSPRKKANNVTEKGPKAVVPSPPPSPQTVSFHPETEPKPELLKRRRRPRMKAKEVTEKGSIRVVPSSPSLGSCFVCNNNTSLSFAEFLGLDSKHSECTVCMVCITSTIRNSPTGQKVLCPVSACQKELEDDNVQLLVPDEDYQEYIQRVNIQPIECSICLEPKSPDAYPDQITSSCHETHDHPGTCITCMQDLLSAALDGSEWIHPSCPDCSAQLSISDVQLFGTLAQVETFDNRLMKTFMQGVDEYRQCLRPGCNDGQIHDGGAENPIVTCNSCQFQTCFTHNIPFHEGMTCTQYDEHVKERDKGLKKTEEFVRANCKSCPRCKFDIMKAGGCDHMMCQGCHYEFCWLCMARYDDIRKEGSTAHQKTCKYYPQYQRQRRK
ncbi:hypothetical protein BDD12DRAFT_831680 [Trichophaea hybrida]|nr:hypothetical protein BDD12DRAFT_831680 [Trichophaea hybrida]